MRTKPSLSVYLLSLLLAALPSCERKREFADAARIVERQVGHERIEGGTWKWELLEVLGADGPYTATVNQDYRGSGGSLSAGQAGTFSVFNGAGSVTKAYGGKGDPSTYMAIPVQNQESKNAVIICRTIMAK